MYLDPHYLPTLQCTPKIQSFPGKLNGLNELISEMDPNRGAMSTQHNPLEYHAIQKRLKI